MYVKRRSYCTIIHGLNCSLNREITASPGLYAQPAMLTGQEGLPHSLDAPTNEGGKPAGLSLMVQFPAGLPLKKKTMIYDNLSNIDLYKGLSTDIYTGLLFLN